LGAAAAPSIAVAPEELDMGRIKPGGFAERPLTLSNRGDAPLVIDRVISSCPCATVSPLPPDAATVPPGGSLTLTVRYTQDAGAEAGNAAIVLYSNDPEMPAIVKDLRVFSDALVVIFPPDGVHWGLAPRGLPLTKDLVIAPGDIRKDIELLSVACSVPGVIIYLSHLRFSLMTLA
jgi:hypothetical protein